MNHPITPIFRYRTLHPFPQIFPRIRRIPLSSRHVLPSGAPTIFKVGVRAVFPFRAQLATGGGGVQIEIFQTSNIFFPFRAELMTGGGVVSKFFRQKMSTQPCYGLHKSVGLHA